MEWMGAFVQIVHDEVYPDGTWPGSDAELILVPLFAWKLRQRNRGFFLEFPGRVVEIPKGHVCVARHLLDLGIDDECLLGFFRD